MGQQRVHGGSPRSRRAANRVADPHCPTRVPARQALLHAQDDALRTRRIARNAIQFRRRRMLGAAPILQRVPQELFVELTDLRLHLLVWEAPAAAVPVVLLPATGETADDWNGVAARLSTTRTVFAVDLPGHGLSDWSGHYSIASMADAVLRLLPQLPTRGPADLVGHSLGGLIACRTTATAPELVRRLVLEDVGVLHPRDAAPPDRPPGQLQFDWRVVEQVRPEIDDPADDWPSVLTAISAPTLIIAGGATSQVAAAHVAELAGLIPACSSVTVEAGHLVHANQPEAFLHELTRFLDS
jgi:pimeloyl-ACP methyl ester carboxylesterase